MNSGQMSGLRSRQKKIHSFASVSYEIGLLLANIIHVKILTTALGFYISPKRYVSDPSNEVLYILVDCRFDL